jgi:Fe-S cluster biogenesis protein NfuA
MTTVAEPVDRQLQQIETLVARIEEHGDPATQDAAREMVRILLDLHATGLARILDLLAQAGPPGRDALDACVNDDMVRKLLLLHGLHPDGLETRVLQALGTVRPYMESHGGNVELLGICDGTVRLRMDGSCKSCPSSRLTFKARIERAIYNAAPDVVGIEVAEEENVQ